MITFVQMKTFVTVVETNSFNQAAKKMAVSPAEISRRISALEEILKVKLLHRTTRRLTLTHTGEIYFIDCQKILNELENSHNKILSQQQEPTGTLSVYYGLSEDIFPKLQDFMKLYPKVTLQLSKIEKIPDFKKQEADVFIGLSAIEGLDDGCVRKKIGTARDILCATPEYLSQNPPIKKPIDLNQHSYIEHLNRPQQNYIYFKKEHTIHVSPVLYLDNSEEMVKAALSHIGLIWIHEFRVNKYIKNKSLVEVLPDYANPPSNNYMVYYYDRYLDPKIRVFVDFFSET